MLDDKVQQSRAKTRATLGALRRWRASTTEDQQRAAWEAACMGLVEQGRLPFMGFWTEPPAGTNEGH